VLSQGERGILWREQKENGLAGVVSVKKQGSPRSLDECMIAEADAGFYAIQAGYRAGFTLHPKARDILYGIR